MPRRDDLDDDDDRPRRRRRDDDYDDDIDRRDYTHREKGTFGSAFGTTTGVLLGIGSVIMLLVIGFGVLMCAGCGGCMGLGLVGAKRQADDEAKQREADAAAGIVTITRSNVAELADHPERFKNRRVKIEAFVTGLRAGEDLKEKRELKVLGRYPSITLRVNIRIPPTLANVPAAKDGDSLIVTFDCGEGSLTEGNDAVDISRPRP